MKKLNIQNILVPIDFSEMSIQAIDSAKSLARRVGANIHLVHVYQFEYPAGFVRPAVPPLMPLSYSEEEADRLTHKLHELAHANEVPLNSCHLLIGASPFHEICGLAREIEADLIVMPTHGRGFLKHFMLGSTAERVVQHAPCPVLVAKEHAEVSKQINRILAPVDFSECSLAGLQYAIQLAEKFAARILVLHAVPMGYAYTDGLGMYDISALEKEAQKNAELDMVEFVRRAKFGRVKFETAVRIGIPVDHICDAAEKENIDLIVTSTHGRTGFSHVMMGSAAEQIVRRVPRPVLVVPSHPEIRGKHLTKKPQRMRARIGRGASRAALAETRRTTEKFRRAGSHPFPERRQTNKFRESHLVGGR